jgi:hypothetical protein
VDIEKRLALSEYKRNKDKKKIKKMDNDLYETEDYEEKCPIEKTPTIEKQTQPMDKQPIDKQQDKTQSQPIITDEDFESKLKGIIETESTKDIENNNDKQSDISPLFKLISKRRKLKTIFSKGIND